jgi:acetyl-CoA/propionyl-CoA carboxylase biotin carboxyl carrier protein
VRLDAGYGAGQTVPQAFDSLIGKLVVTGASRKQALERSRRALAEFTIGGMPTVLPFHRAVVDDPAFAGMSFGVHTRWIETEFSADLEPQSATPAEPDAARERLTVEVGGKRLEVVVPAVLAVPAAAGSAPAERPRGPRGAGRGARKPAAGGDALVTPMQGTIVKIVAGEGTVVKAGDTVVILEAMKMEQPLTAHKDGTITSLAVEVGQTVSADTEICQIKE